MNRSTRRKEWFQLRTTHDEYHRKTNNHYYADKRNYSNHTRIPQLSRNPPSPRLRRPYSPPIKRRYLSPIRRRRPSSPATQVECRSPGFNSKSRSANKAGPRTFLENPSSPNTDFNIDRPLDGRFRKHFPEKEEWKISEDPHFPTIPAEPINILVSRSAPGETSKVGTTCEDWRLIPLTLPPPRFSRPLLLPGDPRNDRPVSPKYLRSPTHNTTKRDTGVQTSSTQTWHDVGVQTELSILETRSSPDNPTSKKEKNLASDCTTS